MILLHTFSKGVKIDVRLPRSERFASIVRSGVLLRPPVSAGVLEPLKRMGGTPGLKKVKELVCSKRDHSHFCNGSNTPARAEGGGKNATPFHTTCSEATVHCICTIISPDILFVLIALNCTGISF